jgi:hypothetical protein
VELSSLLDDLAEPVLVAGNFDNLAQYPPLKQKQGISPASMAPLIQAAVFVLLIFSSYYTSKVLWVH